MCFGLDISDSEHAAIPSPLFEPDVIDKSIITSFLLEALGIRSDDKPVGPVPGSLEQIY
jgi:hypothetical protein